MTESRNYGQAENSIPPLKLRFAGGIKMAMLKNAVNLSKIIFSAL